MTTIKYAVSINMLIILLMCLCMALKLPTTFLIMGLLVVVFFLNRIILGKVRNNYRYKEDTIISLLIIILLYYFLTYIIGYFIGFVKSNYLLTADGIFKNAFPYIVIIVLMEINRHIFVGKFKDDKVILGLIMVSFIMIDVALLFYKYSLTNAFGLYRVLGFLIFPSITKNIFLTYCSLKNGFCPNIVYKLLMEIPVYMLPIFPNFDDFISSLIQILLPIICLLEVIKIQKFRHLENVRDVNKISNVIIYFLYIVLFSSIVLSSGRFNVFIVTIATGSMEPNLNVGDIAIVKKEKVNDIKVGNILVYKKNDITISHRVVEVKNIKGKKYFRTKGDNNSTEDAFLVNENEVKGIIKLKIPRVGYPVVWLNRNFKGA